MNNRKKPEHRSLQELNLLDDFLFGSMLTYPEISENFARILLEVILQRKFGKLTIVPQKVLYGADTDLHGSRLDVYMEEGDDFSLPEDISVYDGEVDHNSDQKSIQALPKRVRFYHSIINTKSLASGESYKNLKRVVILMITDYDPFGRDRMLYTIRNQCIEEPEMPYDDGAMTLFLYTGGTRGIPSEELQQFLHYMQDTREENAVNAALKKVQKMVNTVKQDPEVTLKYMKVFEREQQLINAGREEGREEERSNTEREKKRAEIAEKVISVVWAHPDWGAEQLARECGCSVEMLRNLGIK